MQIRSEAPEVLVLMQCGTNPQGALACVTELAALPGWWGLPAVKNGAVYIVDHAPFLRPGPRVVRILLPYIIKLDSGATLPEYPRKILGFSCTLLQRMLCLASFCAVIVKPGQIQVGLRFRCSFCPAPVIASPALSISSCPFNPQSSCQKGVHALLRFKLDL